MTADGQPKLPPVRLARAFDSARGRLRRFQLVVGGTGRERTETEYAELLTKAGFRHTRTVATVGPGSVIEAEPA